jgi:hypothetical protein
MSAKGFEILTWLLKNLVLAHFFFCKGLVQKWITLNFIIVKICKLAWLLILRGKARVNIDPDENKIFTHGAMINC